MVLKGGGSRMGEKSVEGEGREEGVVCGVELVVSGGLRGEGDSVLVKNGLRASVSVVLGLGVRPGWV